MATRKKAKPKRKKTPLTRGRKRRKTIGKTSAIRKKAAKKAPHCPPSFANDVPCGRISSRFFRGKILHIVGFVRQVEHC